jgi:hypothetical protein
MTTGDFAANGALKWCTKASFQSMPMRRRDDGGEVSRTGSRGEQLFTAAIFAVPIQNDAGLFPPGSQGAGPIRRQGGQPGGYAEFARLLQDNNLATRIRLDRARFPTIASS